MAITAEELLGAVGSVTDAVGKGLVAGGEASGDATAVAVGKGFQGSGQGVKEDIAISKGVEKVSESLSSIPSWVKWAAVAWLASKALRK